MKQITYIFSLFIALILTTSCEDVIVLDLKDTDPRIVIDATMNTTEEVVEVLLSETNGFYDNSAPLMIENAEVTITNEEGTEFGLDEVNPGSYTITDFETAINKSYTLTVTTNGVSYTATTITPELVEAEALDTSLFTPPFGDQDPFYQIQGIFTDQAGQANFYRVKAYVDGELVETPFGLYDDRNFDGEEFIVPIMRGFDPGDLVTFELLTIDRETFDYFYQLAANSSQGFGSSVPFNPKGNFDNNALGYFGSFASSKIDVQL